MRKTQFNPLQRMSSEKSLVIQENRFGSWSFPLLAVATHERMLDLVPLNVGSTEKLKEPEFEGVPLPWSS